MNAAMPIHTATDVVGDDTVTDPVMDTVMDAVASTVTDMVADMATDMSATRDTDKKAFRIGRWGENSGKRYGQG